LQRISLFLTSNRRSHNLLGWGHIFWYYISPCNFRIYYYLQLFYCRKRHRFSYC